MGMSWIPGQMRDRQAAMNVSVIGAAISANKGAASMFYGLLDGLADEGTRVDIALLTTYPEDDKAALGGRGRGSIPDGCTVRTVNAAPPALLLAFVLALPVRLLDRLRLPLGPLLLVPLIRAVRESDVTVDLAGIALADGRGPALLGYNVVMSLFPFLAGGTVVKGSQALGPFTGSLTHLAARIVLPRMAVICARGATTRGHLDSLGLGNVIDAADIAFLMHGSEPSEEILSVLRNAGPDGNRIVAVLPSSVVDSYASDAGIDHIGTIAEVIDQLIASGVTVIVVPHSFRRNGQRGRMNDGPIVSDIESRTRGQATFINRDLDPRELRTIIDHADVAVTGRFHGMVSALEVGTPPVVIGWSHKYGEVLDQFDVGAQGIPIRELSTDRLLQIVRRTLDDRDTMAESISAAHDAVHVSARRNIDVIVEAATKAGLR